MQVVIAEIAKILSENKFKKKKEDEDSAVSGKNTLEYISKVYHVFKDLNDLTSMPEFQVLLNSCARWN
jgi:DNA-directed RNA polymerase subunit F